MNEYVIMPKQDYQGACDAIRAKTGKTDLIKSGDMATEIEEIKAGGGGSGGDLAFNIHYGAEAPEDTSKLWVKTSEPSKVLLSPELANTGTIKGIATPTLLTDKLPLAMNGVRGASVGTKIYLFGGESTVNIRTIQCFDTESGKLVTLGAELPTATSDIGCASVGTKIYLFGGGASPFLNKICCFDTESETITTLSVSLPISASGIGCASVGTKIYLFGGYLGGNDRSNKIFRFDTTNNTITTLSATLPRGLNGIATEAVGTKIYLLGGAHASSRVNTINCFDTDSESLVTLSATLPMSIGRGGSSVVGTNIYIFGGVGTNRIFCFDTVTEKATTMSVRLPATSTMYDMGCAEVGAKIYLFGGDVNGVKTDNIYLFDLTDYFLASGSLHILVQTEGRMCTLVDTSTFVVEIGLKKVFMGNESDKPEQVEAYLYNETTSAWETI